MSKLTPVANEVYTGKLKKRDEKLKDIETGFGILDDFIIELKRLGIVQCISTSYHPISRHNADIDETFPSLTQRNEAIKTGRFRIYAYIHMADQVSPLALSDQDELLLGNLKNNKGLEYFDSFIDLDANGRNHYYDFGVIGCNIENLVDNTVRVLNQKYKDNKVSARKAKEIHQVVQQLAEAYRKRYPKYFTAQGDSLTWESNNLTREPVFILS